MQYPVLQYSVHYDSVMYEVLYRRCLFPPHPGHYENYTVQSEVATIRGCSHAPHAPTHPDYLPTNELASPKGYLGKACCTSGYNQSEAPVYRHH